MKSNNASPFTHGMEIEQFTDPLPRRARTYTMNNDAGNIDGWHPDPSGPRESAIGPYKNGKSILNKWFRETRDQDITWDWHAQYNGQGAGSHVHLCVAEDVFDERDPVEAWTISYNTVVELWPFFAPFFCHDWEQGFREGAGYNRHRSAIERWAGPTLTRFSRSTMRDRVNNPHSGHRDNAQAVVLNPADGGSGKPLTIELRTNDAHPSMALSGLLLLRRLTGRAIEGGWSPKLADHSQTLRECYTKIYDRAHEVGLLTAMQEPIAGGIVFQEGRGIPGVDEREFDTMWDVLTAIFADNPRRSGTWKHRTQRLVSHGRDDCGPQNNPNAIWEVDADKGHFQWERGPTFDVSPTHSDDADADDGRVEGDSGQSAVAADGGEN